MSNMTLKEMERKWKLLNKSLNMKIADKNSQPTSLEVNNKQSANM